MSSTVNSSALATALEPRAAMASHALTLDRTQPGSRHVVAAVTAPADAPEWSRWLEEIGFIPGEEVLLMARAALGGDPLVVRVGQSTFALRAAEAACVRLEPTGRTSG